MKIRNLLAALGAAVLLLGCGGGGGSHRAAVRSKGTVTVTVHWPQPSRLIPSTANSVRVILIDSDGSKFPQDANRPSGSSIVASPLTFNDVAVGSCTVDAKAYPTAVATPNTPQTDQALASGSTTFNVEGGSPDPDPTTSTKNRFDIGMGTTLNRIYVKNVTRSTSSPVVTIIDAGAESDQLFDLVDADETFTITPYHHEVVNGVATDSLLLLEAGTSVFDVSSGDTSVLTTTTDAGDLTRKFHREAGAFETTVPVAITYNDPDGTPSEQRSFKLNMQLKNVAPGEGRVTVGGLPSTYAANPGLYEIEAILVEAAPPAVRRTYVGTTTGTTVRFANVASNGNKFYVRLTLRVKTTAGGFVNLVDHVDITDANAYIPSFGGDPLNSNHGLISFSGSSIGTTNTVSIPSSAFLPVDIPVQTALSFNRGNGTSQGTFATITGIGVKIGTGSGLPTVVLDPKLFQYKLDHFQVPATTPPTLVNSSDDFDAILSVSGAGTSSWKVKAADATATSSSPSGRLGVTFNGGDPTLYGKLPTPPPTVDVDVRPHTANAFDVTITPNGGHIGVQVG